MHGERTKEAMAKSRRMSAKLLYLRDIGDHIGMFIGGHSRGRKPTGYVKLNMNDPVQLKIALLLSTWANLYAGNPDGTNWAFWVRVQCSPINNRTNSSEVNLRGLEELNGEKYSKYFDEKFILFLEDR